MPLTERDIYHFVEVTVTHLRKITDNEVALRDPTLEFQSLVFSAYTGLMHVKGAAEGFVYVTASQQFLQQLYTARHSRARLAEENCRDVIHDIASALSHQVQARFGPTLKISEPRIFSTVPDDPIEMPPAVFVQPMLWRKELLYLVIGLTSPETSNFTLA